MSALTQAFLAALTAAIIAASHAVHAGAVLPAIGWSLAAWCCVSVAAGIAYVRGMAQ